MLTRHYFWKTRATIKNLDNHAASSVSRSQRANKTKTEMSRSFSPGSSRLQQQFGGVSQRLRSSSSKKPPEPLRRAVADYLASSSSSSLHGNPSTVASEAARTLRDYLAAYSTTDLAYSVIVEHALAERERRCQRELLHKSINISTAPCVP